VLTLSALAGCGGDGSTEEPLECEEGTVEVDGQCLADTDGDEVPDEADNCPDTPNPEQTDSNEDGVGDACSEVEEEDTDGDGVLDETDNCPQTANPEQLDHDGNGIGDACEEQDGSSSSPFIISVTDEGADYEDERSTADSPFDEIDSYPPNELDESGPEYLYVFTLPRRMRVEAWIDFPEPPGVDVDIHLLSSLDPLTLIERDHSGVFDYLEPGTYYLSLDTYAGEAQAGDYHLHVLIEPAYLGTEQDPVLMQSPDLDLPLELPVVFVDQRDTTDATSDQLDVYPPNDLDQSGPEVIYAFTIAEAAYFAGELLLPEPEGTDIDLHLLSSLQPLELIDRADHKILAELEPGTYYLVADTFGGEANTGAYTLNITLRSLSPDPADLFGDYMVLATEWIHANYGLLGYDIGSVLTHDFDYGPYGVIPQTGVEGKTMCVAAVMEIILTAMQLYEQDTGHSTVWDFLPMSSYRYLGASDIKAHIWVNYGDIDSAGTADALRHFGMGMNVPFSRLMPGSVVNVNRTTATGHAVVFLAFIDIDGNEYATYPDPADVEIVGFKYYSSQGSSEPGYGGMSYRWAVFDDYGCPSMPGPTDCNIIKSDDQGMLNTGVIYHPDLWRPAYYTTYDVWKRHGSAPVSTFDSAYFTGKTTGDPIPPADSSSARR
jgi:hypothetical protein